MTRPGTPDTVMIPGIAGQTCLVLGYGASGQATALSLAASDASVIVADDSPQGQEAARAHGFRLLESHEKLAHHNIQTIVAAPGIPFTSAHRHHRLQEADSLGITVIGDIHLWRMAYPDARLVLVTGSNGKSSTTALIEHGLRTAGIPTISAGNIGLPVLGLPHKNPLTIYIFELSSFQLDLVGGLDPAVSVWLNLSSDHLDRHGDMAQYHRAKTRIFLGGKSHHQAVVGVDDEYGRALAAGFGSVSPANLIRISGRGEACADVVVKYRVVFERREEATLSVASLMDCPNLEGAHNAQNAAAASAALRVFGVEMDQIQTALRSYPGLPHRSRLIGEMRGVRFINDSKATNVESARPHFMTGDPVYWLAGGKPKPGGFASLEPVMGQVARAYFFGEAAREMAKDLGAHVSHQVFDTLDEAFHAACADVERDRPETARCLLAPACASFDQFSGFAARGAHFEALVQRYLDRKRAS